jgi:transposase
VFTRAGDHGVLDRYDDGLLDALGRLKHEQRVAVLLVHGHGYRYDEVAEVLGVSTAVVRAARSHRGTGPQAAGGGRRRGSPRADGARRRARAA